MDFEGAINTEAINGSPLNLGLLVPEAAAPIAFEYSPYQGAVDGEAFNGVALNWGSPVSSGGAAPRGRLVAVDAEDRSVQVPKDRVR